MLPCELSDRVIQRADASDDIACISGGDIAVFALCHVRFPPSHSAPRPGITFKRLLPV